MEEKLIRPYDVGVILGGFSSVAIRNLARRGHIPGAVYFGRHVRFRERVVREFIESGGNRPCLNAPSACAQVN